MLNQCHNCTVEYRPKRTKNKEQRTKNKEQRTKKKEERKFAQTIGGMEYPLCST
jgi:hypothetical protein